MGRKRNWPPAVHAQRGRDRVYWWGKWHDLGPAGSAEAKSELARLLALWALDPTASKQSPNDLLVSALCKAYIIALPASVSVDRRRKIGYAVKMLLSHHRETPVNEFGPMALAAWQKWLCDQQDTNGEKKYSRAYITQLVSNVRRIWKWGVATERIDEARYNALLTVEGPAPGEARKSKKVRAAPVHSVDACLPFLRPPTRAMVQLQQLAGFRPSELFRMTPRQVIRKGTVELPDVGDVDLDQLKLWLYLPDIHKSEWADKEKWILLGPQAQKILTPFLNRGDDDPCFSPRESVASVRAERKANRQTPKWPSHMKRNERKRAAGKEIAKPHYTSDGYRQAVRRACVRAGVKAINPYEIRHRFGVSTDATMGLDATQAAMGHSSPQTTRRYSKRSFQMAADVAQKMG